MSPLFGLAVAITYIVILDATGLRIAVGKHASLLNKIVDKSDEKAGTNNKLREGMGHIGLEVIGGLVLGTILAFL